MNMKLFKKHIVLSLVTVAFTLVSCSDLNSDPEGGVMTSEQLNDVTNADANKMQAKLNGIYSRLTMLGSISSWNNGTTPNFDFGYAAACMMYDASGMDEPAEVSGYNWFRRGLVFSDRTQKSSEGYFLWLLYYSHIKIANDIIASTPDNKTANSNNALGQAYASRAFDYLHLIQMYQFTYKGHENAPGVPIVTDSTSSEQMRNNPRASVANVYKLILSDLNKSIDYLNGISRSSKTYIDQHVAYGLRARANLLMQNWDAAASDAEKAADGFEPLSITDAGKPGFNSITASNWIWGSKVSETSEIVTSGIINFPSMMCSFTGNGYSPAYTGRYINNNLYDKIDSTDVRKGWWLNKSMKSSIVDTTWTYQGYSVADWFGWRAPYLNVKFGPYKNEYNNATNACDLPLMRVEEMLLIKAEALAMGGHPEEGKKVLENFVRTYRDPNYACTATTSEGIQDAVWMQRRIELWGEGFSFFDMMRLKKPLLRKGTNYGNSCQYDLPAESQIFLYIIPEDEVNNNAALKDNNNPIATVPVAK